MLPVAGSGLRRLRTLVTRNTTSQPPNPPICSSRRLLPMPEPTEPPILRSMRLVTIVVRVRFHPPLHHCCGHDTTIFEFTCIHITISINTIIIPIAALFKLIVVSVNASRKSAVAAPKTLHTCILVRGSEKVIATPQQTQTVKLWQLAAWLRKDSML